MIFFLNTSTTFINELIFVSNMAKKLKIEYYKNLCIGQGSCAAMAPDYFELISTKATLLNSKKINEDTFVVESDCDENTAQSLIDAAKACPVNAIRVIDTGNKKDILSAKFGEDEAKKIIAKYDDAREFVMDQKGYFLIRIDRKNENIEVAFRKEKNKIILKVIGKKPIEIYQTVINKEKLDIRKDHAAYLGRELQKAYIALKNNLEYVQDDELDLNKKHTPNQ